MTGPGGKEERLRALIEGVGLEENRAFLPRQGVGKEVMVTGLDMDEAGAIVARCHRKG